MGFGGKMKASCAWCMLKKRTVDDEINGLTDQEKNCFSFMTRKSHFGFMAQNSFSNQEGICPFVYLFIICYQYV